jgi:hypothetical protein
VALEDGGLINGVMEGLGLVFRRAGGGSGSGGRCGASRREDGESVHSPPLRLESTGETMDRENGQRVGYQ